MENGKVTHDDYLRYDRVWQRVAPELDPYPEVRRAAAPVPAPAPEPAPLCVGAEETTLAQLIDHELADRQAYLAALRCAPGVQARRVLHQIAEEEGRHVRRLMGLYYMVAGQCCRPALCARQEETLPWCQILRQRYQAESCAAAAYHEAAEQTGDLLLRQIFCQLAQEERRHAGMLLRLLEGNLPG